MALLVKVTSEILSFHGAFSASSLLALWSVWDSRIPGSPLSVKRSAALCQESCVRDTSSGCPQRKRAREREREKEREKCASFQKTVLGSFHLPSLKSDLLPLPGPK